MAAQRVADIEGRWYAILRWGRYAEYRGPFPYRFLARLYAWFVSGVDSGVGAGLARLSSLDPVAPRQSTELALPLQGDASLRRTA